MRGAIESLNADETLEHNWEWTDMVRKHKLKGFQASARINMYLELRLKSGSTIKLLLDYIYIAANSQPLMKLFCDDLPEIAEGEDHKEFARLQGQSTR